MIGMMLNRYPANSLYAASLASKFPELVLSLTVDWPRPAPRYSPLAADAGEVDRQQNSAAAGINHSLRVIAAPCSGSPRSTVSGESCGPTIGPWSNQRTAT